MIPKFRFWIEDVEAGGVSVSQPQHKKGEDSLDIDKMVEKRIKELINELKIKRNIDENQIINSIKSYLGKSNQNQSEPESEISRDDPNSQKQDLSQMSPPQSIQSQTYA